MLRRLTALAFVATCAGASTAFADDRAPGVELAARLGYGLPMGDVDSHPALTGPTGDPLGQTIGSMVPVEIDGGYRWSPRWYTGLFFAYAPGLLGDALGWRCNFNEIGCSVSDVRAGAEVQYHPFAGSKLWDPWFGAGLGYEWLHLGISQAPGDVWASGLELLNLQAGLDLAIVDRVHVGPFVAMTVAEYFWRDSLPSSNTFSGLAPHAWVVLGVKGTFDLSPRKAEGVKGGGEERSGER